MKYSNPLFALPLLPPLISGYHRQRCAFGDACWPSPEQWASFNSSISGRLISSFPSAAVCHREHYDKQLCHTATSNWTKSFWRTSQVGAYAAIAWELGQDQCFINTTIDAPCGPGLVAHYSVAAQNITDIQAAVKFADYNDLYLVIKNTGHDHLGRSSGKGAFTIWTHNIKGREWYDAFVPKGSPNDTKGIPAVTLQAGEQWLGKFILISQVSTGLVESSKTDAIIRRLSRCCGAQCYSCWRSSKNSGSSWWLGHWRRPLCICAFLWTRSRQHPRGEHRYSIWRVQDAQQV